MNLTAVLEDGRMIELHNIEKNDPVEDIKALIKVQGGNIPEYDQIIYHYGKELHNGTKIEKYGIKDHDCLTVSNRNSYKNVHEPVYDQHVILHDQMTQRTNRQKQTEQRYAEFVERIKKDPNNKELQQELTTFITNQNQIECNAKFVRINSESLVRAPMLYIDCHVNNVQLKAFVDSGAQQTMMSKACATRCGLQNIIDCRYFGIAKGLGVVEIIGKVHGAQIKIGTSFFPCAFNILENQGVEFLLGLDMLKRHQCSIDLKKNELKIGDHEVVPFFTTPESTLDELISLQEQLQPSEYSRQPTPTKPMPIVPTTTPIATTTATTTTTTTTTTATATPTKPLANSAELRQLLDMGFSIESSKNALHMSDGDVEQATNILLSGL